MINKKKGFTLFEIIVAVALLSLLVLGFFSLDTSLAEYRSRQRAEIVNILELYNKARLMALNSSTVQSDNLTVTPENGFGVFVDLAGANKNIFILFADTHGDTDGEGNNIGDGRYGTNDTEILRYEAFSEGAFTKTVVSIVLENSSGPVSLSETDIRNEMTILYAPPHAEVTIEDNFQDLYNNLTMNISLEGVLEEEITFHKIGRFFEREQLKP